MKDKLFIIDTYGFVFRAYHIQPTLTTSLGMPTGALYGLTSMLIKFISDFNPQNLVCVFDAGGKNFRHDISSEYKAHRPELQEDLKIQLPITRNIVESLGIKSLEMKGYEADDIIASLVHKFKDQTEIIIISSDKDLMQLIDDNVCMYDPIKSKYIKQPEVIEKFGVPPSKMLDLLSMVGDSSDNIQGIKGVGPKTAAELLEEYGTLENMLANANSIKQTKRRESILSSKDIVMLAKRLITLKSDIQLDCNIENFKYEHPPQEKIEEFLALYEFSSLLKRFSKKISQQESNNDQIGKIRDNNTYDTIVPKVVDVISDEILGSIINQTETIGYAFILNIGDVLFVSTYDKYSENQSENKKIYRITHPRFIETLINNINKPFIKIITYNQKKLLHFLYKLKIVCDMAASEDLMLMHYVASSGIYDIQTIQDLINLYLKTSYNEDFLALIAAKPLFDKLNQFLIRNENYTIYKEIDIKLSPVLFHMEKTGVKVDDKILAQVSHEISQESSVLEGKIFKLAGREFNIGSPKQLGEILFEKLKLPFGKSSGKAKNYSTNAEVLDKLSESGFVIADYLLEWRTLTKIQNTYADSLPKQINTETKRIHTDYSQAATLTGRLSSLNPNLQNIPIRSKLGNRIREAFVPEEGCSLISADYSQIELRVLASIANISALKEAFSAHIDIHTATACKIFRLHENDITPEHRRKAKAINFGIIYGISPYGLAKQLSINPAEAKEYISGYFAQYPGIYEYMERIKTFARENGYVHNLFGRRCAIAGIKDSNGNIRKFSERSAINAPIQSTAADIAKIAMIKLFDVLNNNGFKTKMLLQVHDEIVFESPQDEVEKVAHVIKSIMESSVKISVPLVVDFNVGDNWKK